LIEIDVMVAEQIMRDPIWVIYERLPDNTLNPVDIYYYDRDTAEDILDEHEEFFLMSPSPEPYSTDIGLAMLVANECDLFGRFHFGRDSAGYYTEEKYNLHKRVISGCSSLPMCICRTALKVGRGDSDLR